MAGWIRVPAGTRRRRCRDPYCQRAIYWVRRAAGGPGKPARMRPVDCDVEGGCAPTETMDGQGVSHFKLCPGAARFRRAAS